MSFNINYLLFFFTSIFSYNLLAHHSFLPLLSAEGEPVIKVFDANVEIYKLLNPHTAMIVNTYDEGQKIDWLVELSSASTLTREGWTNDFIKPNDRVTIAILAFRTENRGRLRALLIHPRTNNDSYQLIVAYGIRGDTPIMKRLESRLPLCGNINAELERSQCFLVNSNDLDALKRDFPGVMGYIMP